MKVSDRPPGEVQSYARLVTGRLRESLEGRLRAAYLHGSAVLGGWVPARSDVDMLFVTDGSLSGPQTAAAAAVLAAAEPRCPGSGLECSVVTAAQAAGARAPWPFLLHIAHARGGGPARLVRGGEVAGDPDLLMHYAVCRAAGWPAHGPEPEDLIGLVPRPAVLGYLAGELPWALDHATEPYAVLNACRAVIFLTDDTIVSKVAGGRIALRRGLGPPAALSRALDQQLGTVPVRESIGPDAADFVLAAARGAGCGQRGARPAT